jgi:hypothetical protein
MCSTQPFRVELFSRSPINWNESDKDEIGSKLWLNEEQPHVFCAPNSFLPHPLAKQSGLSATKFAGGKQTTLMCAAGSIGRSRTNKATSLANDLELYCGWLMIVWTSRSWYGQRSFVVCVSHSPKRTLKVLAGCVSRCSSRVMESVPGRILLEASES